MKQKSVKQAVILVGGRGTRLGKLTENVPKPLLEILGRPFLEYLLNHLRSQGVEKIVLCVGYLRGRFVNYFGNGAQFGLQIEYSQESRPAGTGGALALAGSLLDELFFVLNGDTIFDAPVQSLAEMLLEQNDALGAIALRKVMNVSRYGRVDLDGNRIVGFDEKNRNGPGLINGGIYCLRKAALALLPSPPCSIEKDFFPLLAHKSYLLGHNFSGYFIDIGLPETLKQAESEIPHWLLSQNSAGDEADN